MAVTDFFIVLPDGTLMRSFQDTITLGVWGAQSLLDPNDGSKLIGQQTRAKSLPVTMASDQPTEVREKVVYDMGDTTIYVGYGVLGSATSAAVWSIKRVTLVAGNPTAAQWSPLNSVWDDRASLVYT